MKSITKALVGTVAAGAMVMAPATPAFAQYDRDDDGIGAGEVIAGALILGGIAAVVAAASNNDNRRYNDGGYYNGRYYGNRGYDNGNYYNRAGNSRQAVEQCVHAAQQNANRYSYG